MALLNALREWVETCDSEKCTEAHQSELHSMCAKWIHNSSDQIRNSDEHIPSNNYIEKWFKHSGEEKDRWGKIAWLQTESTFSGRLEEKHRAFETATNPEIRSPEGQLHNFLKRRFRWTFGRIAKKDLLIEEGRKQPQAHGDNNELDEFLFLDKETAKHWRTAFQQDHLNTKLIQDRLEEANAIEELDLKDGDWSLLLLLSKDLKPNEDGLEQQWETGGLPAGKTQRYERVNRLETRITGAAREALSSQFVKAADVDVLDVSVASRIMLKQLFQGAEQHAPEKFRARVFEIINGN